MTMCVPTLYKHLPKIEISGRLCVFQTFWKLKNNIRVKYMHIHNVIKSSDTPALIFRFKSMCIRIARDYIS